MSEGEEKIKRTRNADILDRLFEDTGCFRQICTQLDGMIPTARYDDGGDDAVLYQYYMK